MLKFCGDGLMSANYLRVSQTKFYSTLESSIDINDFDDKTRILYWMQKPHGDLKYLYLAYFWPLPIETGVNEQNIINGARSNTE